MNNNIASVAPERVVTAPNEVSQHLIRIIESLQTRADWTTVREVAEETGCSPYTVRPHLRRLSRMKMVDVVRLYPGFRYKWSERAQYHPFWQRLIEAKAAFRHAEEEGIGSEITLVERFAEEDDRASFADLRAKIDELEKLTADFGTPLEELPWMDYFDWMNPAWKPLPLLTKLHALLDEELPRARQTIAEMFEGDETIEP